MDGTPFETDPDVLAMLGSSPPQTRAAYERMTGRRYRDPGPAAQARPPPEHARPRWLQHREGGQCHPADGPGQPARSRLVPDVFFKCVINGEQTVRTGSVVMLRLLEDAVVSGVTFPRNLVFAGVATVGTNNLTLEVNRLGPTRVQADIYDFNYLPGIMIDPVKRVARQAGMAGEQPAAADHPGNQHRH